ncbi:MAG: Hint domain-containing protein [Hyphomicrobiaceae bacterium]
MAVAGDIAFVGVVSAGGGDNTGNPSYFAFVVRAPITSGSIISFTDALPGINVGAVGTGNDGIISFTASTNIAVGSVVIINTENMTAGVGANISNGDGTLGAVVGEVTQTAGNFSLNNTSATVDQIYAYNNIVGTTVPAAANVIAGIDFSSGAAITGAPPAAIIADLGGIGGGTSAGSFITINAATATPAQLATAGNFSTPVTGTTTALLTTLASIDTVPPTVTSVVVAGDEIVTTGEESPLTISGSVAGANGGSVTIAIFDGATQVGSVTTAVDGSGNYSTSITGLTLPDAGIFTARATATDIAGNTSALFTQAFDSQVCFLAGTMIRTPAGETAIEKLAIGDLVITADGAFKPIKFIGRQTISMIFTDKLKSQPILIKGGALGENLPARDLYTSPGHSMLVDGNLVIASALVNGRSVVRWQQCPSVFTYYHIELDGHEIVFAEGAATETYCDNVPREVFDNAAQYKALYPNATPIKQLDLPTVKSQRQLPAATRRRLAERAAAIGALVEAVA